MGCEYEGNFCREHLNPDSRRRMCVNGDYVNCAMYKDLDRSMELYLRKNKLGGLLDKFVDIIREQ